MKEYIHSHPFTLENGKILNGITINYATYGELNADASNVVWVCHALTANAEVASWWPGLVGEGCFISPEKHFIICANIIGSCYGSTGPASIDPATQQPYQQNFPQVTIRDMVQAHQLLREHLGIKKIHLLIGGSMGGYQALEWCVMEKDRIENLFLLVTSATESAWGIGIHSAQRLAIEADPTWNTAIPHAGQNGLKAARAIGILSYRNYNNFVQKQSDTDTEKTDDYRASSYINYQGQKLASRFNTHSYWLLTKAMDSHHIARGRGGNIDSVLASITQKTLVIGISSDILCPVNEQKHLATAIPNATYAEIDSDYGHDGFLIETEKITAKLRDWL
ncbi:homoserine O-acetyltransferase [Ferruginibacter sp. HRS2-29]|uniref:homoserine O-acetyltransferase MetX n=1 Tax=Ferruginibacter sp. HRS2-29 TaxID=2487334 RepID=UPI0020CBB8A6|nr:homoserine O-acetyltransferase [Ferruginibacter sp. HRS2-29]MCP9751132.1 homoserine O-acetyltransferase [Ferruginibacter sp. HRS2-29]